MIPDLYFSIPIYLHIYISTYIFLKGVILVMPLNGFSKRGSQKSPMVSFAFRGNPCLETMQKKSRPIYSF